MPAPVLCFRGAHGGSRKASLRHSESPTSCCPCELAAIHEDERSQPAAYLKGTLHFSSNRRCPCKLNWSSEVWPSGLLESPGSLRSLHFILHPWAVVTPSESWRPDRSHCRTTSQKTKNKQKTRILNSTFVTIL